MADTVYVVTTTINPGVEYAVDGDEFQQLIELGLVATLVSATVPSNRVVISPTAPTLPTIGQVWFNTNS